MALDTHSPHTSPKLFLRKKENWNMAPKAMRRSVKIRDTTTSVTIQLLQKAESSMPMVRRAWRRPFSRSVTTAESYRGVLRAMT